MKRFLCVFIALAVAGSACGKSASGDAPTPTQTQHPSQVPPVAEQAAEQTERLLGIDVNETSAVDFGTAFSLAQEVGLDFTSLSIYWDELETAPGEFKPDPNWLEIANDFYGREGVALSLVLAPIDTNVLRLPPDLENTPFDAPELIDRYLAALDYALDQLTDVELVAISVGNEVDVYLSNHPQQRQAYGVFYEHARRHLHGRAPGVPIGLKATYEGLTGAHAEELRQLNASSDVILATYYPLEGDFSVKEPSIFKNDMERLLDRYPDRPIYLLEVGYPSSPILGSSEEKQAEFVRQVFTTWDRHHRRIPLLNFTWLHDVSQETLDRYEDYYGLSDRRFLAYLGSLGLRTNDGRDKQAYHAFQIEAGARKW